MRQEPGQRGETLSRKHKLPVYICADVLSIPPNILRRRLRLLNKMTTVVLWSFVLIVFFPPLIR